MSDEEKIKEYLNGGKRTRGLYTYLDTEEGIYMGKELQRGCVRTGESLGRMIFNEDTRQLILELNEEGKAVFEHINNNQQLELEENEMDLAEFLYKQEGIDIQIGKLVKFDGLNYLVIWSESDYEDSYEAHVISGVLYALLADELAI